MSEQTKKTEADQLAEQNNSIITTATAASLPATSTTPSTSPINNHTAQRQQKELQHEWRLLLSEKSSQMIELMKKLEADVTENVDLNKDFDWKQIVEVSENIFTNYCNSMGNISKEFEDLNREFLVWQEAAYIIDTEKASKRLGRQEKWINDKESFLSYTNKELVRSANMIDDAIKHLRQADN